jgi:hypothetical protein
MPRPVDADVGSSAVRALIAAAALAIVASPLAAAIGRTSANRALVATTVAAATGGIAYVVALALLRSPELRSLLAGLRRSPASLDV